jgi:hypothetical protein
VRYWNHYYLLSHTLLWNMNDSIIINVKNVWKLFKHFSVQLFRLNDKILVSIEIVGNMQNTEINIDWIGKVHFVSKIELNKFVNIHAYHSRLIPEGAPETPKIYLRVTRVLWKLLSYEGYSRCDRYKMIIPSPSDRSLPEV